MVELRVSSRESNKVRVAKHTATEAIKNSASRRPQKEASPLPRWISPQLCQFVETARSGSQWLHEIKLDGFRMSARIERGRVQLLTRTGLDWSDKYPSVVEALAKVRAKSAYLDGELCGIGDDGLSSFSQTQAASDGSRGVRLVYFAFDLLHLDGRDIASLSLMERKGAAGAAGRGDSRPSVQRPRYRRRRADQKACRPTWA
jgi:ATP-dependent DNA ligase